MRRTRMRTAAFSVGIVATVAATIWMAGELVLGSAVIQIENRSGADLEWLEINGRGFSRKLERLRSGESACFRISESFPESGLELVAKQGGREVRAYDGVYIEDFGGYHVVVTVSPGPSVDATHGPLWVGLCWLWS
jgi:hypothetical protein